MPKKPGQRAAEKYLRSESHVQFNNRRLRRFIQFSEGRRLFVYDDATGEPLVPGYTLIGNPTIGVGRNIGQGGKGISNAESEFLEKNDVVDATSIVRRLIRPPKPYRTPGWETPRGFVLVDLADNLGEGGLAAFKGFIAAVERNDWERAADELLYVDPDAPSPRRLTPYHDRARARACRNAQAMRTDEWPPAFLEWERKLG